MPCVRPISTLIAACFILILIPARTSAQGANFLAARTFPASQSDTIASLTVEGDFNGDSKPDLVVVTNGQVDTSISILLGDGDGTFKPPVTISTGPPQGIVAIEAGDFNGDGDLDFVFTLGEYSNTISVFLGNGDGTFQAPIATTLVNPPQLYDGLAVGDFNRDGRADIALSASAPQGGAGSVLVLISNGNGTFETPVTYSITDLSWKVVLGDFNGDGKVDLATAGEYSNGISILLGNGDGTFQAADSINLSGSTWGFTDALVVGDFNRDGKDDLAIDGAVLLSNGDGTLQAPICNLIASPNIVTDLNNDGILDLAWISNGPNFNDEEIFLGNGDGTFQSPITFISSLYALKGYGGAAPVVAADFDGDGNIDLAGPAAGNNVTVILGNGDGTFRTPMFTPSSLPDGQTFLAYSFIAGDSWHDGKADLVLFGQQPNQFGDILTLLGNGNGTFQAPTAFGSGDTTFTGVVGDFNNDGKPDLAAISNGGPQVTVLLGNGDGTFLNAVLYDPIVVPAAVGVGDFNGDGHQDIVVTRGGELEFLYGNGDGTFGFAVGISGGPGAPLLVGDVNGDGKPDIVGSSSDGILIFLGNGDGTFQSKDTVIGAVPTALALADFNHDGKLDLAVGVDGGVLVLLGKGDGTFQANGIFPTGGTPNSVVAADFNGDGILDLAVGGLVSVLLGNGDGTFQPAVRYDAGGSVAASDFNGDGQTDLAVLSPGGFTLLFNGRGITSLGLGIPSGGSNSATVTAGSTAKYTLPSAVAD